MKSPKHLDQNSVLVDQIDEHAREGARIEAHIESRAPQIVERLCKVMSLREVARRCNLSPTYICELRKRHKVASKEAFKKLVHCESVA